jgi:hypothetical protein
MSEEPKGKAKGGVARANALTPEQRKEIAKKAAEKRWNLESASSDAEEKIPVKATHEAEIQVGDMTIACAVLEDGRRVLSERGISKALGRKRGGEDIRRKAAAGGNLPVFLGAANLKPFIDNDLLVVVSSPVFYRPKKAGGRIAHGLEASVLPKICEVWLKARDSGLLTANQMPISAKADMLMRGFAHIGIIALIDEATGYQELRDKHALQAILDAYLRHELAAWAKRFPDEFYQHIFRLRGWEWKGRKVNPPQVVAYYTKDIVYARLAPGILEELENRSPVENGRRRSKFHQWLTEDVGHPALAQHLHAVITLMRVSTSWDQFRLMLDTAHPRRGDTLQLPLMSDFSPTDS